MPQQNPTKQTLLFSTNNFWFPKSYLITISNFLYWFDTQPNPYIAWICYRLCSSTSGLKVKPKWPITQTRVPFPPHKKKHLLRKGHLRKKVLYCSRLPYTSDASQCCAISRLLNSYGSMSGFHHWNPDEVSESMPRQSYFGSFTSILLSGNVRKTTIHRAGVGE